MFASAARSVIPYLDLGVSEKALVHPQMEEPVVEKGCHHDCHDIATQIQPFVQTFLIRDGYFEIPISLSYGTGIPLPYPCRVFLSL